MRSDEDSNELRAFHIDEVECNFFNPHPKKDAEAQANLPKSLQLKMVYDQQHVLWSKEKRFRKYHLEIKLLSCRNQGISPKIYFEFERNSEGKVVQGGNFYLLIE